MAERMPRGRAVVLRAVVLVIVLATAATLVWRATHRREDYRGGDVRTTGTIEAVHVQLGFNVTGRLADVPVVEGQEVQAGQLVGRLQAQDFEVAVRTAQAALAAAHATLAQAEAQQIQAQVNRDKAARDLARIQSLMDDGATTPQLLDAARAEAEATTAQVGVVQAQRAIAAAHVQQAESALAQAQLQLSYVELRAPEHGQVSERIHRPGEMVMAGTPVVALAETDTIRVNAAVDETRVGAVRPGDRVEVRVYTFDHRVFTGVVTEIKPAGDFATRKDWGAQRRDIRTFTVTARLANPEQLLKDGMTAEVTILVAPAVEALAGSRQ